MADFELDAQAMLAAVAAHRPALAYIAYPNNPTLLFDGRIAEDFKLSTGTFVSVGPLRAKVIAAGAPLVQDAVVAGFNRDDISLLVFPRLDECRKLAGLSAQALADANDAAEVLGHAAVHDFFQQLADPLWQSGTGSANRVAAAPAG